MGTVLEVEPARTSWPYSDQESRSGRNSPNAEKFTSSIYRPVYVYFRVPRNACARLCQISWYRRRGVWLLS